MVHLEPIRKTEKAREIEKHKEATPGLISGFTILSRRLLVMGISLAGFFILQAMTASSVQAQVLDMNTPATTKYVGHTFNVAVRVNTQGQQVDTIAVRNLNFDPALLEITATSIQTVFASQVLLENVTNNTLGTKRIDIGKLPATANLVNSSPQTFATLTFRVLNAGSGSTTLGFDFDPTPTTSGTFLTGVKNLTAANPLTVTIAEDTTPPVISNCAPTPSATNVFVITTVACDFQDFETGVHLAGTSFVVNGVTYLNSGSHTFSAATITNGYRLTVTPAVQLPYFATIEVSASAQDNAFANGPVLARNTGNLTTYTFQTEQDIDAPQLYAQNPAPGAINVPVSTNLVLRIRDIKVPNGYPGIGLDLSSVTVTASAPGWGSYVYTQMGSPSFVVTPININHNYEFLLNLPTALPENTTVTVQVQACDLRPLTPNCLNTSYQFTTVDSTPPNCSVLSPQPGAANVPTTGQVVINCSDDGVGVNIDSVDFFVGGINYTATGPDVFSYTGSPASYQIVADFPVSLTPEFAFPVIFTARDNNNNPAQRIAFGLAAGVGEVVCPPVITPPSPPSQVEQPQIVEVQLPASLEQCLALFPQVTLPPSEQSSQTEDVDQSGGQESQENIEAVQTAGGIDTQSSQIPLWLISIAICPWIILLVAGSYLLYKKYNRVQTKIRKRK